METQIGKGDEEMIKTERIDWVKVFKQDPHRWLPVYKDTELIEVHDTVTSNVYFKVDKDRWMVIK